MPTRKVHAFTGSGILRAGWLSFISSAPHIIGYEQSADFLRLSEKTRKDYSRYIRIIEKEFGTFPLSGLKDRRSRGIFKDWRDKVALRSARSADYGWVVLARILSWAFDRGLTDDNSCKGGGRFYKGSRAEYVWTDDDQEKLLEAASPEIRLAFLLALWTGQRQGDLLRLPWSAYDGSSIKLRQGKTGARVAIPVAAPLKAALDEAAANKKGPLIETNTYGHPWTSDGFRSSWSKVCQRAGIENLTFHDLRGTAVTRLALAGASVPEIASLTGHSLKDVHAIIGSHYLDRDPELAKTAVAKLEAKATGTEASK